MAAILEGEYHKWDVFTEKVGRLARKKDLELNATNFSYHLRPNALSVVERIDKKSEVDLSDGKRTSRRPSFTSYY